MSLSTVANRSLTITRRAFSIAIAAWFVAFFALSSTNSNNFQLLNIFGFLFLIILPGLLTIIAVELKGFNFWGYAGLAIGLSLLELMLMALLGNTFLPLLGIMRPLDKPVLLLELYFLIGILASIAWVRIKKIEIPIRRYGLFDNRRDLTMALTPAIFVVMSVFGAIRLNNGASSTLTLIMLIGIGIYCAMLARYSEKVGPDVIPTAFFFMSLSLLFMTSLRGWLITGHDIELEYHVFELTKYNGLWSIANFRNVYNACLSITILPTLFSNLLHVFDPYIYKIFFQIIFATLPGIIYLTVRRYTSAAIAFLSTFYFIAFPIFFTDMPFLNRQEVAFLFLGLMFYVIFDKDISLRMRRALFLAFGIGLILSHYSTTYTVIAILIFLAVSQPIVRWIVERKKKNGLGKPLITATMVVIIAGAAFLWGNILTNTASGSLYRVVAETIAAMENNTKQDARAGDVSYGLLSWKKIDPNVLLQDYEANVVEAARAQRSPMAYYAPGIYAQYPIVAAVADSIPLTPLGTAFERKGINVASLGDLLRQGAAKVLQLFIIIGFFLVIFRKKFIQKKFSTEFILLSAGSLIFVASQVILPVLSVEYGVLRAFQQSLIFLGAFIVIGSFILAAKGDQKARTNAATAVAIAFFFCATGIATQMFGGYGPQLSLNNNGAYYDIYYTHKTEAAGIEWLTGQQSAQIQTDPFSSNKIRSLSALNPGTDLYPELIRKDSYVFLGFTEVHKNQTSLFYNGTLVAYTYPLQFLDDNKNLLYNNGDVRIYR